MLEWQQVVSIQYLKRNSYDVIEIEKIVILNTFQNFHFQVYSIFVKQFRLKTSRF